MNNHVTFATYVERAENALADAQLDAPSLTRVSIWFSRPSFAGELMHSVLGDDDGALFVQFSRAQSGEYVPLSHSERFAEATVNREPETEERRRAATAGVG